jgi:benzylsuccinate CoA-transferase BbsF subunit
MTTRARETAAAATARRALDGIRVLDLSQVAIGPYATFLLVTLGAEVIKLESNRRPDITRGPVKPVGISQMHQYPDNDPGERPWNRGAYFNQRNRGKLGVTLDFSSAEGKAVFKRLVAKCDAVIENYRASVLDRQGLGWDALREVNRRLVYLKLSSQGATGPQRDFGSLGSTLEQTGGIASITGYTDGLPLMTNETYPDPVAGILGVGALIAALRRVRQTGEGQFVDLSQREVTAAVMPEAMMDYALNGRVQGPIGNRDPSAAPHGVYPCRPSDRFASGGDGHGESKPATTLPTDNWLAIAVLSDDQWRRLRTVMADPAWAADPAYDTVLGRLRDQETIDGRIAAWTADQDHIELMGRLQGAGVPAGAVLNGIELLADPQLRARDWWEHVTPTEVGRAYPFIKTPWLMSGSPYLPNQPAPRLGEHNDYVYREVAGLSEEEYRALQDAGVISTEPLW